MASVLVAVSAQHGHEAVSHQTIHLGSSQHSAQLSHAQYAPAPVHYAPAQYHQAAPVYAAPAQYHHAAPVYAPPAQYHHASPVYAAPAQYHHAAPAYVQKAVVAPIVKVHEAPAHYSFEYAVHDSHTGDIKEQKESRNGDQVQGYYSLVEADGTRRIVHYTADAHNGFNAQVSHEGKAVAVKAAPVLLKSAVPVAHHGYHY